jgi:hypothetical protein
VRGIGIQTRNYISRVRWTCELGHQEGFSFCYFGTDSYRISELDVEFQGVLHRENNWPTPLRWASVRRCSHCRQIDSLRQHPAMHSFFRRPLCRSCIEDDDFRLITARTANKAYFLNNTDLLSLTTISRKNPHHPHAHLIRMYSREQVKVASTAKLTRLGLTLEQRRQQQLIKSQKARASHRLRKQERRRQLRAALHRLDLPSHGPCKMAKSFINGGVQWRRSGHRPWSLDEVLNHFQFYPCDEALHHP